MSFAGRHVVITGGAGALGSAVVQAFHQAGALCHLPVRGAADGVTNASVTPGVDLTDEAAVTRYYAGLPSLWASVHLAGGFAMADLADTKLVDLHQQLELNLVTAFLCCREASRRFTGGGRIVNVSSRPALVAAGGMTAYSVSKAAVSSLTQSLAEELRPRGVLVNAIAPSIIDTPTNRHAMPGEDYAKWPKPAEIASTILWLASPDNTLTSGAIVPVYGNG